MKQLALSLCASFAVFLTLLHCVASQCSTAQDCHPGITGLTVSEDVIACTDGECVCNSCFVRGSDGNCTLREGCWKLVFSGGRFECRMEEKSFIFSTPAAVLFGVSAVLFVLPIIIAAVCVMAVIICYRRCSKLDIPNRYITPAIAVACACFWTLSAVFILAGIILATTSESTGNSTCLQLA